MRLGSITARSVNDAIANASRLSPVRVMSIILLAASLPAAANAQSTVYEFHELGDPAGVLLEMEWAAPTINDIEELTRITLRDPADLLYGVTIWPWDGQDGLVPGPTTISGGKIGVTIGEPNVAVAELDVPVRWQQVTRWENVNDITYEPILLTFRETSPASIALLQSPNSEVRGEWVHVIPEPTGRSLALMAVLVTAVRGRRIRRR